MGEKNLSQKNLESFSDMFADYVNALIYKGEQVLRETRLLSASAGTLYPDEEDMLHNIITQCFSEKSAVRIPKVISKISDITIK